MQYRDLLLSGASGLLLGVGFLIPILWPVCFIALIPFFLAASNPSSHFRRFSQGWILGFVLHLCALHAIFWETLPVDWFGIESLALQILIVGFSWVLASFSLAIGTGLFAILLRAISLPRFSSVALLPVAWIIGEIAGAAAFSLVLIGPGSTVGPDFTLGHLGYLLANDPVLLQGAWFGGVYALSGFIVCTNVLAYYWVTQRIKKTVTLALIVLAFGIYIAGHMWLARVSPAEPTITVAAVSTYAAPELYLSPETERQRAASITEILSSIGGAVDTIVLPESATYLRHTDVQPSLPLLIDAENVQDEKGQSHSVATYVYENGTSAQSAKQFLLPLGEYTPYVYRGLLALFSTEEFRAQVLKTRSFVRGEATTFAHTENLKLAVRFCDEVMSPRLFAGDVQRGADILVNLSSFSWFHGSTRVYDQMQLIAKVRAVESRRAYVQSGNMAPAFVLDAYGRVQQETTWQQPGAAIATVSISSMRTPYRAVMSMQR